MDMMLEQFKTIFDRPEKVKKLREIILKLAIKGKLLPQDSNDEPVSALLERIKQEKEILLKNKIISKPKISVVDYENHVEIPDNWMSLVLSDICYLCEGRNFEGKDLPYLEVKYLRGKIKPDIRSKGKFVEKDTYLLLMDGENSGEVFITTEDGYLGSTFKILIINNSLNKQYINYLLLSYKEIFKKSKKGAAIPHLDRNLFNNLLIGIPPIEEQGRIVKRVNSLMNFCDKLEKALEKKIHYRELSAKSVFNAVGNVSTVQELEETLKFILLNFKDLSLGDNAVKELKNCILQLAVQGKLVPQDPSEESAEILLDKIREDKERLIKEKKIKKEKNIENIEGKFNIPNNWKWIRLRHIIYDITYGTSKKCDYNLEGVAILRIPNVRNGNLKLDDIKYTTLNDDEINRLSLKKGDLLIIRSNGSSEIVGTSTLISDNLENYSFAGYLIRVRMNNNYINSEYINKVINSKLIRSQIEPSLRTTTGVKNVNSNEIGNLIIPLPPLGEQNRIVEKVNSLMELCGKLEKNIVKYKKYNEKLTNATIKYIVENRE